MERCDEKYAIDTTENFEWECVEVHNGCIIIPPFGSKMGFWVNKVERENIIFNYFPQLKSCQKPRRVNKRSFH